MIKKMSKLKLLTLLVGVLIWSACSSGEKGAAPFSPDDVKKAESVATPTATSEDGVKYEISLALDGDFFVSDEPITRGEYDYDIYGINIYYDKEKDGISDDIYAYGIFDNKASMKVELLGGYKYKFVCDMIPDAKNLLDMDNIGSFGEPFGTKSNRAPLNNAFVIGQGTKLSSLGSGAILRANATAATTYAPITRYYGELTDYTPTQNGIATIHLKRYNFGMKFVVNGMQDDTKVTINAGDFASWAITDPAQLADSYIFCCPTIRNEDWSADYAIKVKYEKLDPTPTINYNTYQWTEKETSKTITFKRNVLTTITIDLDALVRNYTGYDGPIGIEEEEMGADNVINMGFDNNGIFDIIVDPQQND